MTVLGIDRDTDALTAAYTKLREQVDAGQMKIAHGSYAQLGSLLDQASLPEKVDGILVDLGVSSHQLDVADRGFSLANDGALDMRFDQTDINAQTAEEFINSSSEVNLGLLFRDYGDEKKWKTCSQHIVEYREKHGVR